MAMKVKEISKSAPRQRYRLLKEWKHFTVSLKNGRKNEDG